MVDREKVIKRLENTAGYFRHLQSVGFFGDQPVYREHEENCNDAIAMLKEQEQDIQNLIADLDDLRKEHEKLLDKKIPLITNGKEVIRCKDCRFRDDPNSVISEWLPCQFARTPDDWFCACGRTVRKSRTVVRW